MRGLGGRRGGRQAWGVVGVVGRDGGEGLGWRWAAAIVEGGWAQGERG